MNPEQEEKTAEKKAEQEKKAATERPPTDLTPEKDPTGARGLNNKNPELVR